VAKTFATNAGVPLSNYAGVCLTFIGHVDLFGYIGGMTVFCDTFSLDVLNSSADYIIAKRQLRKARFRPGEG
jgi:hypothetical protein